jgi:ABC-type lipoprotein release transport system permease subunit
MEISFNNMRIRFFRSLITMSGVILGIAFFMSIRTGNIIVAELLHSGSETVKVIVENIGVASSSTKQFWLVGLALLVSVVGISNSMLMAVTERFREIGTMKCLGALDRFIIEIFLFESAFQGIVGSFLGIFFGSIIIILLNIIRFGGEVITHFPIKIFLLESFLALVLGTVLSVIGAGYPAYRAAKMQPVDALRQDL